MTPTPALVTNVLINRFRGGNGAALTKFLSEEGQELLKANPTSAQDISALIQWPCDAITNTHYSWLTPVIEQLPTWLQTSLMSSLTQRQVEGLKHHLSIKLPESTVPDKIKTYLLHELYRKWSPNDALPQSFLLPCDLDPLLTLNKHEIVEVIDLLSMYDLVDVTKHIVDKKLLNRILVCLNAQQQRFLRECLHKKEKITLPKLDLHDWDGSPTALQSKLHKRGLLRLGNALSGSDPLFVWHVTHRLDSGRGASVLKHKSQEANPQITPVLIQQVINAVNFIKPTVQSE